MGNKAKQTDLVLGYLKAFGSLTNIQAVEELHIMALARRVMELRRSGYVIDMEYKTAPNGNRYGVYTLREA